MVVSGRGELEGVAVAACDDDAPAARLLARHGSGKEIVRLVARDLGVGEAAGRDEFGQAVKLLDDVALEDAAALVGRENLLPPVRRRQRVPRGEDGARLLALPEADEIIGEADDGAAALAVGATDRFRHGVIGAVGEGIAVDDEQRAGGGAGLRWRPSSGWRSRPARLQPAPSWMRSSPTLVLRASSPNPCSHPIHKALRRASRR